MIDQSFIADFLNHGLIPFVGRTEEIRLIMDFWRKTPHSHGLRALLFTGEAGVGKSRLIQRTKECIAMEHGVSVHVKFYPESSSGIFPALSLALWDAALGDRLLKREPGADRQQIISSLRRVLHLRPTMLILEDIHLLTAESRQELQFLFDTFSEDMLSVLCLARPGNLTVHDILEKFLVDRKRLGGLDENDVRQLWQKLFADAGDEAIAGILCRATRGNSLALRTALRGTIEEGIVAYDRREGAWRVASQSGSLEKHLENKVDLLTSGLSDHMDIPARNIAGQLAHLGEVFSHEAAMVLLDGDEEALKSLLFSGVLSQAQAALQPLPTYRQSGHLPYIFTHSLVHSGFLKNSGTDPALLLKIVSDRLPLYSFIPFQSLSASPPMPTSFESAFTAIESIYVVCIGVDKSPDWEQTGLLLDCAEAVVDAATPVLTPIRQKELHAGLMHMRINMKRRENRTGEYLQMVADLLELTSARETPAITERHFSAIGFLHNSRWSRGLLEDCSQEWEYMNAFLDTTPELRKTSTYCWYLQCLMRSTVNSGDINLARKVERETWGILENEPPESPLRKNVLEYVTPFFLLNYETPEELQSRFEIFEMLEREHPGTSVFTNKIHFLFDTGRYEATLKVTGTARELSEINGLTINAIGHRIMQATVRVGLGEDPGTIYDEAMMITREPDFGKSNFLRLKLVSYISLSLMLRDEHAVAARLAADLLTAEEQLTSLELFRVDLAEGRIDQAENRMRPHTERGNVFQPLLGFLQGRATREQALEAARKGLRATLPTIQSLIVYRDLFALIRTCTEHDGGLLDPLRDEIHRVVITLLGWLDQNRLWPYMLPLVRETKFALTQREFVHWRKRAYEHRDASRRTSDREPEDQMIRLRVIGAICWDGRGNGPERIRGSRNCATLALMAANECLKKRLTHDEFREMATDDNDPENARKKLKTTVYRLREIFGKDAVLTDAETPELNLKVMTVDLIELHNHLREARRAVREKSLLRASIAVGEALALLENNVIFPGLYDEWFESMREEFENRTRDCAIHVIRAAIEQDDLVTAGTTARGALRFMPDDPDIGELLEQTVMQTA